jgi:hypothetical protein
MYHSGVVTRLMGGEPRFSLEHCQARMRMTSEQLTSDSEAEDASSDNSDIATGRGGWTGGLEQL